MREAFDHIAFVDDIIEFDRHHAKSAVAMGACLAAYINEHGQFPGLRFEIDPPRNELGWEVGTWNRFNKQRKALFLSGTALSGQPPYLDIRDPGPVEFRIYRWRPSSSRNQKPEFLGLIDWSMTPASRADINPPVPPGSVRLLLLSRMTVWGIRGQQIYRMKRPRGDVDPEFDPYSGRH